MDPLRQRGTASRDRSVHGANGQLDIVNPEDITAALLISDPVVKIDDMKITIIDLHPPRDIIVSRTFEATDLIDNNISMFLPDLRAHPFLTEVRKLLLYSRFDSALYPWDDHRLNQLEQQTGYVDVQARFPHRWSVTRSLSATVALRAIEQGIFDGLQEMKFYVNWYPFGLTKSTIQAACIAEERMAQFMAPYRLQLSFKSHQAVQVMRKHSARLPWVRKNSNPIQNT
ncbi:hypothetical protein N0V93_005157 [Gnomoniopsis smithogilvyi]|uniref:Uncharacterized protein n=1 Tax=Gnomoniopsis smithogilvyi TaxID=1191159 RepID=A0A9W8YST5_9PEZI|nr:hypothetical protein N0V93_005157 [Gnomoniopsis smithogilvyi]